MPFQLLLILYYTFSKLQLSKMEFRHIDALDPAQKMLDAAQRKGIYENLVCDFIGDHATSIASSESTFAWDFTFLKARL